jgi:capsular polysaccharide biosynthesis protein
LSKIFKRVQVELTGLAQRAFHRPGKQVLPLKTTNVKEWYLRQGGTDCCVVCGPEEFTHQLPRTIEPVILDAYLNRRQFSFREKYLAPIAGARIIGSNGLIILPDGSYAVEAIYHRDLLDKDQDYTAPPRRKTVKQRGAFFSLLVTWAKNAAYYHWLHDGLQRLYGTVDLLPPDVKYIVPHDLRPWQVETLQLLDIRPEQLAYFDGSEVWELEQLYFSPSTTNSGASRPEVEAWLRDTMLAACKIRLSRGHRRIFVSRSGMPQRRLVNELTVAELLADYGFETCWPETLPFRGQVELFSQAEVVISTHGSAFANILFAPPGLVVVDMIESSMYPWGYVFWTMSEALGHHYTYFTAESVERPGRQPDTLVPIDKLQATLELVGLRRI